MSETGVIHDIGYQRYQGVRLGRSGAFTAIYVQGMRAAFGLGRTAKAKIFPWFVVAVVVLVAVIVAAVRSQTGTSIVTYAGFDDSMSWLIIFFAAILAPELMSRDIGSNTLQLYFSRPLRAADYVLAKFAAMITALWLLLGVPQLIMFLGAAFTTGKGMSGVWNELGDLVPAWGYSLLWALVFTSVSLLIASLTGKRAFAAGGIVAFFLVTTPIVGVLASLPDTTANNLAFLASPMTLISGVWVWLSGSNEMQMDLGRFGPIYGIEAVCLIAAALLLLLARYRKVASL